MTVEFLPPPKYPCAFFPVDGDDEVSAARKLTLRSPTTPLAPVHFDHTMFSRGITECNSTSRLRGLSGPLSTVCTADTYTRIAHQLNIRAFKLKK